MCAPIFRDISLAKVWNAGGAPPQLRLAQIPNQFHDTEKIFDSESLIYVEQYKA